MNIITINKNTETQSLLNIDLNAMMNLIEMRYKYWMKKEFIIDD